MAKGKVKWFNDKKGRIHPVRDPKSSFVSGLSFITVLMSVVDALTSPRVALPKRLSSTASRALVLRAFPPSRIVIRFFMRLLRSVFRLRDPFGRPFGFPDCPGLN